MKTFPIGGVHPKDHKISAQSAIETMELPECVTIFTSQHIGAPSTPCVAKGDKVLVGDIIAQAAGCVSANIHSSVSGTVRSIELVPDGGGVPRQAITIDVEGDQWSPSIDRSEELVRHCALTPKEILDKITAAGIVGLGGATFPTQIKLMPPPDKQAQVLIINGVECEPYLTSDHRLMLERGDELLVACEIVMKAIGVAKCYIGIENNKSDAIRSLTQKCSQYSGIEVVPLKVQYPQGGEKQLIAAIIGKRVPSGSLPIEVGAIVQNVGTMYAIYQAVQKNRPIIDRVVTVTGTEVSKPSNLLVRIGTPIDSLLIKCGADPQSLSKVVNGGPMMGRAMSNTAAAVTKGTSAVLVMPPKMAKRPVSGPCISCARCVGACPMGLEPYLISRLAKLQMWDRLERERITDCIECGCCAYSCPAALPLLDYIRLGKSETIKIIRNRAAK